MTRSYKGASSARLSDVIKFASRNALNRAHDTGLVRNSNRGLQTAWTQASEWGNDIGETGVGLREIGLSRVPLFLAAMGLDRAPTVRLAARGL